MASSYIFNYIKDCYDFLPDQDRQRFAEFWTAYQQVVGDLYTKTVEVDYNITTTNLLVYNNERWNFFDFNSTTQVTRATVFTSNLNLSGGVDLSTNFLLKFAVTNLNPLYTPTNGQPQYILQTYEVNAQGTTPVTTKNTEIATAINKAVGFIFASVNPAGHVVLTTSVLGTSAQIELLPASVPAQDASLYVWGIDPSLLPQTFPAYPYVYQLGDSTIVDVPTLQDFVRDENVTTTYISGVQFVVEQGTGVITFNTPPVAVMWARNTLKNLETPYYNFGYLLDFYDTNSQQYLETLQGLWYAYWVGPRPDNIRNALYLLFGLPTATAAGVVRDIQPTYITYQQDTSIGQDGAGTIVTIPIPLNLVPIVTIGQRLTKFAPFTTGITIIDHVNTPGFFAAQIGTLGLPSYLTQFATYGSAATTDESKALQTVEPATFLVQVSSDAFVSSNINIGNIKTFLGQIKPVSKTFLFQILVAVDDTVTMSDDYLELDINFDVTPNVDYNPWLEADPTVLDAGEVSAGDELGLDSEVFGGNELIEVDVYYHASTTPELVDSFTF